MTSIGRYRRLLALPQMRTLVLASLIARTPIGIQTLALVLLVEDRTGSFAQAGAVVAVYSLMGAVSSPFKGRLVDRLGQTRVLVAGACGYAAAVCALVALALAGASTVALAALAAVAGFSSPPVWACLRPLFQSLLPDEELLPTAFALDALLIEGVFVLGPLLTALLVALFSPAAAVVAAAAFSLSGTLWFASTRASREWRSDGVTHGLVGALRTPGMRTLVATSLGIGVCFGTLEVALPAFADAHGSGSLAGVLFALLSIGSALGGLAYGAQLERLGSVQRAYLVLAAALPVSYALLLLPSSVALMLLLVPIAGCVLAPLTAAEGQLISTAAPRGAATEAITWVIMSTVLGAAAGNAVAGAIVQASGWRPAILVGCAVMAAAAAAATVRRQTLAPVAAVR